MVQKRDNAKILIDLGAENICQQIVRKHFGNETRLSLGRLLGAYFAVVRLHTPAALINVALIIYTKSDRVAGVHARLVVAVVRSLALYREPEVAVKAPFWGPSQGGVGASSRRLRSETPTPCRG